MFKSKSVDKGISELTVENKPEDPTAGCPTPTQRRRYPMTRDVSELEL